MRILPLLLSIFILLAGCNVGPKKEAQSSQNNQHQPFEAQQTIPQKPEIKNPEEVTDRLVDLVERIPGVQSANCVVLGNTAIVGINVSGDLDRSRVGVVKYTVSEALRKDPYGVHAFVTADIDIANRLREIQKEIRNGRPISGFAEELAAIIGRMMPQLPKDVIINEQQPEENSDRDQLNDHNL